jgi:hypothetical protein
MDILYEKDICFLHSTGFLFFSYHAFAILLEYVLVDHTEIEDRHVEKTCLNLFKHVQTWVCSAPRLIRTCLELLDER